MKIVLVNLAPAQTKKNFDFKTQVLEYKFEQLTYPAGLSIIASVLKAAKIDFRTYDTYVDTNPSQLLAEITREGCDIFMTSGFLGNYTYSFFKTFFDEVHKALPSCQIVVGGPIASTIPDFLVENANVDIAVVGEGEETVIDLLESLEIGRPLETVNGIVFRDDKESLVRTPARQRLTNLDVWPLPDTEAFDAHPYVDYLKKTDRCWELVASRGCYGGCTFCKRVFGRKLSRLSPYRAIEYMDDIHDKFGITKFNFVDDNFLSSKKQTIEFADILKKHSVKYKWRFQARLDAVSSEMIEILSEVGLYDVSFGIESGSQRMLDSYKKKITVEKILNVISEVKRFVDVHGTFIVGGPGENWDTINETAELIRSLELNNAGVGILTPFPGTEVYAMARDQGLIADEEAYFSKLGPVYTIPYVNMSDLTDAQLLEARDMLENVSRQFGEYT